MAVELMLIKLLAIAVTVFDLVILIDVVIRDDVAFVKFSVAKYFCMNAPLGNTVVVCEPEVLHGRVRCIWVVGFVASICTGGVVATL